MATAIKAAPISAKLVKKSISTSVAQMDVVVEFSSSGGAIVLELSTSDARKLEKLLGQLNFRR